MKDAAFQEVLTSIRQAGRIRRGTLKPSRVTSFRPADVKSIREKLKASQAEFALMIGVSVATLRNWEQGRRTPDGPAWHCYGLRRAILVQLPRLCIAHHAKAPPSQSCSLFHYLELRKAALPVLVEARPYSVKATAQFLEGSGPESGRPSVGA